MMNKVKVNIEKGSEIRLLDPMRLEKVGAAMKDQKKSLHKRISWHFDEGREEGWSDGSDPNLFMLVDSWADTLVDEAMSHYPDSKDEESK